MYHPQTMGSFVRFFPLPSIPGLFTGQDPTRGSGQEVLEISRVRSGWVGSGRVGSFSQTLTDRVGPPLRDPTRHDPRGLARPVRFGPNREQPFFFPIKTRVLGEVESSQDEMMLIFTLSLHNGSYVPVRAMSASHALYQILLVGFWVFGGKINEAALSLAHLASPR